MMNEAITSLHLPSILLFIFLFLPLYLKVILTKLTSDEQKALFLNLYNALIIHGYINCGVPSSTTKKLLFYQVFGFHRDQYIMVPLENLLSDRSGYLLLGW